MVDWRYTISCLNVKPHENRHACSSCWHIFVRETRALCFASATISLDYCEVSQSGVLHLGVGLPCSSLLTLVLVCSCSRDNSCRDMFRGVRTGNQSCNSLNFIQTVCPCSVLWGWLSIVVGSDELVWPRKFLSWRKIKITLFCKEMEPKLGLLPGIDRGSLKCQVAPEAELKQAGASPLPGFPNISKIPGQPWGKIKLS